MRIFVFFSFFSFRFRVFWLEHGLGVRRPPKTQSSASGASVPPSVVVLLGASPDVTSSVRTAPCCAQELSRGSRSPSCAAIASAKSLVSGLLSTETETLPTLLSVGVSMEERGRVLSCEGGDGSPTGPAAACTKLRVAHWILIGPPRSHHPFKLTASSSDVSGSENSTKPHPMNLPVSRSVRNLTERIPQTS